MQSLVSLHLLHVSAHVWYGALPHGLPGAQVQAGEALPGQGDSTATTETGQEDFFHIMRSLPVHVPDVEIEEMFCYADSDGDGRLSFKVFFKHIVALVLYL